MLSDTRVPNLVVLVISGYVPGHTQSIYPILLRYPGTTVGCFTHTRVCTRVPPRVCTPHTGILKYHALLFWSYPGMYPGTP